VGAEGGRLDYLWPGEGRVERVRAALKHMLLLRETQLIPPASARPWTWSPFERAQQVLDLERPLPDLPERRALRQRAHDRRLPLAEIAAAAARRAPGGLAK